MDYWLNIFFIIININFKIRGVEMSNFFELVNKRESCRSYSDKKVSKEQLVKCIEAARLAPSTCNSQPWSFVVVNSEEKSPLVAKCTQSMGMNKFTNEASAFIVVCEEKANLSAGLGGLVKNHQYAQSDLGIATVSICFAATELGLSTCILGWFDEKKLIETLKLPKDKRIRLVIAVGYAKNENIRDKKRKSIDEIMTYID